METEIEKSVVEGNRLIADFIGFDIAANSQWEDSEKKEGRKIERPGEVEDLEYHSSWDWLMPVINKIDLIFEKGIEEERGRDLANEVFCMLMKINIERTHHAVHEFITWYNNQKQ